MEVLVLCTGNICRSPLAEALLRQELERAGVSAKVHSAGLGALVGEGADPLAIQVGREAGLDLSGHIARQVNEPMLRSADLVLVMETHHRQSIMGRYPFALGKTFLLHADGVRDPYGKPLQAFVETLDQITPGVNSWVGKCQQLTKSNF